jgi:hypothetical protein
LRLQLLDDRGQARAEEHHVGRGKPERQPLRRLVTIGRVRFERVVAELPDRETAPLMRRDVELDEMRWTPSIGQRIG